MRTYFFTFKNSDERINSHKARDFEEAVSFFAGLKKLNEDIFLKLYDVDVVESVTA